MNDQEAHEFYYWVIKNRPDEPSIEEERSLFNEQFDVQAIADAYVHVAAILAKDWHEKHIGQGITLGQCIQATNTGLMYAANLFHDKKHAGSIRFKKYSTYFIEQELAQITDRTDTK